MGNVKHAIEHFRLVSSEPCSAIVLSVTEYEILLSALYEFELHHTYCSESENRFTGKGVDIVNALYYHLNDYYSQLKS